MTQSAYYIIIYIGTITILITGIITILVTTHKRKKKQCYENSHRPFSAPQQLRVVSSIPRQRIITPISGAELLWVEDQKRLINQNISQEIHTQQINNQLFS